jgi:UDP-glucose 4-epimerase
VIVVDDLSTGSIANIAHLRSHPRLRVTIGSIHEKPLLAELGQVETNVHGTELVPELAGKKRKRVHTKAPSVVFATPQAKFHRLLGLTIFTSIMRFSMNVIWSK